MHPAKATIVEDLQTKLNASPFLFITEYTGLKVGQFAELRTRLWNAGARCHVVKNTFLRRAAKEAGLPELTDLRGQTAIIVGEKDVAAAAKVLKNFTAEFKKPEVRAGVVGRRSRFRRSPICPRAKSCSRHCSACSTHRPASSSACSTSRPPRSPASSKRKPRRRASPPLNRVNGDR